MNKSIVQAITITIIILVSLYFFYLCASYYKRNQVTFLSKKECITFLQKDEDNYYQTFNKNDFSARNINSVKEYDLLIEESACNLNEEEKSKVKQAAETLNKLLESIHFDYFDGKKANLIPWIIGAVKGNKYENGLPHTRLGVVVLPVEMITKLSIDKLVVILAHEKVHLYQKIYQEDVNLYLEKYNFKKVEERRDFNNVRSNPDLDGWIYKDDVYTYKATYNDAPVSVSDVRFTLYNDYTSEHPFEKMAYEIEQKVSNSLQ